MDEQEQTNTLITFVMASDLDDFAGKLEDLLEEGWLLHGQWQYLESPRGCDVPGYYYVQMMVMPAQPQPGKLDVLEMRIANVENALSQLINRLTGRGGGGGVARPDIILPPNLKGGGRVN